MADPVEPPTRALRSQHPRHPLLSELTYSLLLTKAERDAVIAGRAVSSPPSTDPAPHYAVSDQDEDTGEMVTYCYQCGDNWPCGAVPSTDPPSDDRIDTRVVLDAETFDRFVASLDEPPSPEQREVVKRLMARAVPSLPVPDPPDDVRNPQGPLVMDLSTILDSGDWLLGDNATMIEEIAEALWARGWRRAPAGAVVVFAEGLPMGARLEPAADPDCEMCEGTNAVEDANGDCFDCRPCMDTPTMFRRVLTDKEPQTSDSTTEEPV